jgi:hypothetical protein
MGNNDGHRRIKFEFAVLLALVILTLWQIPLIDGGRLRRAQALEKPRKNERCPTAGMGQVELAAERTTSS